MKSQGSDKERIRQLYLQALSREPDAGELAINLEYLSVLGGGKKQKAWESLVHTLINSKEFIFIN